MKFEFVFVRVCLYVLCGHLLGKGWPLGSRLWCLLWVCHFPIGILGQVWYLIVSIPDLCTLTYFNRPSSFRGEDVWKCWRTDGWMGERLTDAGVTGILLAHPWAFGSGELKISSRLFGAGTLSWNIGQEWVMHVFWVSITVQYIMQEMPFLGFKPEEIRIQEISKLIINVGTWNLFFFVKIIQAVYRKHSK